MNALNRAGDRVSLPPDDELEFLLTAGETVGTLADRFGVKDGTILRAVEREGERTTRKAGTT